MADLTLTDVAFGVGLLTAFFGFYARFIRPSVVSTLTWRKDLESQVRAQRTDFESKTREIEQRLEHVFRELESRFERHNEAHAELLAAVQATGTHISETGKDISEIKTKIAVLEERSQRWGK